MVIAAAIRCHRKERDLASCVAAKDCALAPEFVPGAVHGRAVSQNLLCEKLGDRRRIVLEYDSCEIASGKWSRLPGWPLAGTDWIQLMLGAKNAYRSACHHGMTSKKVLPLKQAQVRSWV